MTIWQTLENKDFDFLSRCKLIRVAASDAILKRLKARGTEPKDLKVALGVSASMASRILKGGRGVSLWHLDALSVFLGVSVPELFIDPDASAEAAHDEDRVKNQYEVTSPDRGAGVVSTPEHLPVAEGRRIDPASSRKLSDLEVLQQWEQIYDSTDAIRAAADALRGGHRPESSGGKHKSSKRPPRDPQLPKRAGGGR